MSTDPRHVADPSPKFFRDLRGVFHGIRTNITSASSMLEASTRYTACGPRLTSALDAGESEQHSLFITIDDSLRRLEALLATYQGAATADRAAAAALQVEDEQGTDGAIAAYWRSLIEDSDED